MPVNLSDKILALSAKENYTIYDSFMGVGTTAISCLKKGLNYIGSEINIKNYNLANDRIEKFKSQTKLFQ